MDLEVFLQDFVSKALDNFAMEPYFADHLQGYILIQIDCSEYRHKAKVFHFDKGLVLKPKHNWTFK
jgi:hypothetical protein